MIEPFLCRVSFAGVPHTITHSQSEEYTISGLSAEDMCKLYWTLNGMTVRYSFSINEVSLTRTLFAESDISPKNRLVTPVEFYQTGYDSEYDTSYLCRLNFNTIYLLEDGTLGVRLLISEIDSTGVVNFNTIPMTNMSSISYDFNFMDTLAKIYLNYNPDVVTSATIEEFMLELNFIS